jgi:purine-binding chemotaxis protein CheW
MIGRKAALGTDTDEQSVNCLIIALGSEWFAIPGPYVREVSRYHVPTPVPHTPATLLGLISRHGTIFTVVATHLLYGMPATPPGRHTRYVIVTVEDVDLALLVDAVDDLVELPLAAFVAPPEGLDPRQARLIRALAHDKERTITIIDLPVLVAALKET